MNNRQRKKEREAEASQQESSAAMAKNYKREGWTYCGACDEILPHDKECIPRRAADHPSPAPPEAQLSLGVPPLVPLTPAERAQDLVEWRQRIEEHRRGKEEK